MKQNRFLFATTAGLIALAAVPAAQADPVGDFYKGKRITMFVGSGPGGGYDTYSRAFIRYYKKYIPGNPNFVVKNMPGATGLRVTNHMYNRAKRDGSEVASTFNTMMLEPLLGNKRAQFDVFKFNWLGSLGKLLAVCVTWHTSPIKTLADAKGKEITVSATGSSGNSAKMPRVFNWAVGTNFKVIQGYSTSGSRLALERGEVQGICWLGFSTLLASNPDWIVKKRLNYLAQIALHKHPKLPDVPLILQNVPDEKTRKVLELILIQQEPGRPYIAPPEVPADRVKALTVAFGKAVEDKGFLAEAEKLRLEISHVDAKTIGELLTRAYNSPRDIVEAAARLVGPTAKGSAVACSQYTKSAKWCRKARKKKAKK
jgi:tripartite-type tricarboxylate transporter receptor subunit TctC